MSSAIIVANPFPPQLVALKAELMDQAAHLCAQADTCQVTDLDSLKKAEELFINIDRFGKAVHEDRMVITRQIDALKKAIIEAEDKATEPLAARKKMLGQAVTAFRTKIEAERRAAERKAREEAERQAAEIRRQQEEERKAALAKWEAEQAEARKRAEEEASMFGEVAQDPPPAMSPPPPPVVAPVVPVMAQLPVTAMPKSPVRMQMRKRTLITDREALMAAACKEGGKLYGKQVLEIIERAVDDLVKAGVAVPGATTETYSVISAGGSR